MEMPSQVYPPWLSPVPSVITDAAGIPVTTVTGVVYVPPTYYGPSIPLGSLYSYGGSTYPPTIVLPSPDPSSITSSAPNSTSVTTASGTTTGTFLTSSSGTTPATTIASGTAIPPTPATPSGSPPTTFGITSIPPATTTDAFPTTFGITSPTFIPPATSTGASPTTFGITSPPPTPPPVTTGAFPTTFGVTSPLPAPPPATTGPFPTTFGVTSSLPTPPPVTTGAFPTTFGTTSPGVFSTTFGITSTPPAPTTVTFPTTFGITSAIPTPATTTGALPTTSGITSAIPTTSVTLPTTFGPSPATSTFVSTTSVSSTSISISRSSSSSVTSSSFTPVSTTPGIPQATGLTKGQLVGIIVASILGLIFFFVLGLFLFLWFKALRNRRRYRTLVPIDDDYVVVPTGGRSPGEGSPRHSGEETDPFLHRRAETSAAGAHILADVPSRRGPPNTTNSNSSASTNSHASGFGVLLDRPGLGLLPSMPEDVQVGQHFSPAEMQHVQHQSGLPDDFDQYDDGEYTGAYAYNRDPLSPGQRDPAAAPLLGGPRRPHDSHFSNVSTLPSDPEETATLHTARRVRVEELGPRSKSHGSEAGPSRSLSVGILGAIGLGGLVDLGRRSWFRNFDSPRQSSPSYYSIEPLSDKDIEEGRSSRTPERAVDSFGARPRNSGLGVSRDKSRPVSGVSGRSGASGASQYHDAQSSLPGTPSLTPLPRARTPADQPPQMSEQTWMPSPLAGPPAYEERPSQMSTPPPLGHSQSNLPPDDVLDMPVPTAVTHFASMSSLNESNTGSSLGGKVPVFPPPGLETVRAVGWSDIATPTDTTSRGSFGSAPDGFGLPTDFLEGAPPEAEQRWKSMAFTHPRRGTFGTYVQGPDFASERGSLHSMRSHFSPSTRSTGSAPAGRLDVGSLSSNASRPSAHSRSASSGVHSLAQKGSVSSDSRRKFGSAAHSPAFSAFGPKTLSRPSGSPLTEQTFESNLPPVIDSPPIVHVSPHKSSTIRTSPSDSTTLVDTTSSTRRGFPTPTRSDTGSPFSATFPMNTPWAGGLDFDWQPAA